MSDFSTTAKPSCSAGASLYMSMLPNVRAGTLSQSERETLHRHLRSCQVCREQALLAADELVADAMRRHFGSQVGTLPFLTFDAIRQRTSLQGVDEAMGGERRPIHLHDGGKSLTLEDKQLDTPSRPAQPMQPMQPIKPPARWRVASAVMATVALVAVFALLVHGFVAGRGVSQPAAQTVSGQWHTVDTMTYTSTDAIVMPSPAFSPVNPSIVYETTLETTLSPDETTVSPASLRRSDDGGATWHALQTPGLTGAIMLQVFPSPLDAHTAFLTVTNFCPSGTVGSVGKTHGGILAAPTSGNSPACSVTYRTTDEGQSWTKLSFPVNGVISVQKTLAIPTAEMPLQAQGTRLYAMLTCGPQCADPSQSLVAGRLAASTDGGATWSLVDGGISQGICDFAAQSDGQALFVVTTGDSQECDTGSLPSRKGLYRSDDGGQSWQSAGMLPESLMTLGMAAVSVKGTLMLYAHAPALNVTGKGASFQSASDFLVSSDGGKTWTTAPLEGLSNAAIPRLSPVLVRPDGSLIVAFSPPGYAQQATIYSWKPGASSWKVFAPAPAGPFSTLLRTVSASGAETFWAVIATSKTPPNQPTSVDVFTFTVAKFQP